MLKPSVQSTIQIESIKHDGALHRRWEENTVLEATSERVIGFNHRTIVTEASRASYQTTIPALFYFEPCCWFNIVYLMDTRTPYYYCNIASPPVIDRQKLQYIDYDIDLIVYPDFSYKIVDEAEYKANKKVYDYPKYVDANVNVAVHQLERKIRQREAPFKAAFIEEWQQKSNLDT